MQVSMSISNREIEYGCLWWLKPGIVPNKNKLEQETQEEKFLPVMSLNFLQRKVCPTVFLRVERAVVQVHYK